MGNLGQIDMKRQMLGLHTLEAGLDDVKGMDGEGRDGASCESGY